MSLAQQPPFLICVPIQHSKAWPGLAAREIEALLDLLGNPAGPALKNALDTSGVVHFLSLSVVWDEDSKDPPILVADVAADGTPKTIIAALVKHAGALLLPVFQAAAGVESLPALGELLEHCWIKPVGASVPLWPHRATGLPFQGTPDLTVARIKEDSEIALKARAAVFSSAPLGPSAALSYLAAARQATGIANPRGKPFSYSTDAPGLSRAGAVAKLWTILSLIVFDWASVFIILFVMVILNIHDILGPISQISPSDRGIELLSIPLAVLFGIVFDLIVNFIKVTLRFNISPEWQPRVAILTFVPIIFATWSALHYSPVLSKWILNIPFVQYFLPFVWWVAGVLGLLSLLLFLALVAWLLLMVLRHKEKHDKPRDADPDPRLLAEIMRREDLAPHKQNHMIAVSTISPGLFRRFVSLPAGLYAASLTVRSGLFKVGFLAGIGSIHFIQWAHIPRTGKLVFTANYDGSWQSYLEDAITLLPGGATGIWSNAVGFPETSWLFSDGATDGDRFKRWVRRQMIPTRFWYSAYPDLTTTEIRLNAAVRLGLEAATITSSEAETWLKLFGSAPRPASGIETDQIQGVALSGYRNLLEGALLAISFPEDKAACRAWLADVSHRVVFGDARQSECAMAVALSARGMERLGLGASDPLAAQFLPAFAMGMAHEARANVLGDVGANAPGQWEWGGPHNPVDAVLLIYAKDRRRLRRRLQAEGKRCVQAGMNEHKIHLRRWPPARRPITEPFGFVDGISQPSIRGLLSSRGALATDLLEPGEFILGYPDGRTQFPPTPQVFSANDPRNLLPDLPLDFPTRPSKAPVRDLGRNGSYLAIRQLKQDVPGYQKYLTGEATRLEEPPDWVAAKMVGRWPNGAPLALFPHEEPKSYDPFPKDEKFMFGRDDPQGLACPLGAHIRRANPRDQFDPGDKTQMSITNRHRIIRRGRSYVDGDNTRADPQGLLFMCLNADLERQFEFLQQTWIGSTSFGPLSNEADPLTALNRESGTYTIPTLSGPKQLTGMPSFVSVIGGGYFFLPGRQALNFLSR